MDTGRFVKLQWLVPSSTIRLSVIALVIFSMGLYAIIWSGDPIHNALFVETEDKFPLIIHQAWESYELPEEFYEWVSSWLKYNPHWEYWFWSGADIDALISDRYPDFRTISNNYKKGIGRADAIRYMILHEVGGFYADLDMECLQPLIQLPRRYSCLLSKGDSVDQANLKYHRKDPVVVNCVMGCRPGHPFFEAVVDRIHSRRHVVDASNGTGSMFFTSVFEEYQRRPNTMITDHIHLLPPKFLLSVAVGDVRIMNNNSFAKPLSISLTTRHRVHGLDTGKTKFGAKIPKVNIKTLVPSAKFYSNILTGKDTSMYYV